MPTIRLTQLAVGKLAAPPTGRVVYWDRHLPGFGMRVTATGAKSWVAKYRVGQKAVFETIGTLARVPKVEDARQAARDSMSKAASGANPVVEKRVEVKRAEVNTAAAAVERYLAHCDRTLRTKTATEWRRIFEHDVLPRWGERPIAEITKADVLELVNDKAARRERKRRGLTDGAAVQAGKMLTRLRTFFGWAAANDLVAADPTAGVRRPAKEASRDRVLSHDEIAAFWEATDALGNPFGLLFRLLLLTAQRESEVAGMRWGELDLAQAIWTIPGSRAKNGKPHIVHLSALALETIAAVPRIAGQDLLFSGSGKTPVSGFSSAKTRLDKRMLDALRKAGGDEVELPPWTLHDLRRTATTGMARLGIAPHVADKVLNHTAGTIRGVAAVYNRFEYLDERKAALEAWGRYIEGLIGRSAQNVVRLSRQAML
jgi:integrase